eukprot:CAMPEP_0195287814 /NCGR_PEP_ID=MMETSP0707-20130614/4722_1 /TAXON_ID=33640 /ORGANISM="Asterionellopsis glacialis, Strain CCMP134" /LENGTH=670 /DNA_ID=CAMNT_0040347605 /DNA_START=324 /DNA_END=2336 /DNA_ORIENTATION=+
MNSAPKHRSDEEMTEKIDRRITSASTSHASTALGHVSQAVQPNDPSSGVAAAPVKSGNDSDEFEIPQRFTKNGRKRAVSFPLKLMKALSCKEHSGIIAWLPDGKKFKIIRPRAFKQEVLPRYFKEAKYSSFKRKLHRWGFERDGTLEQQQCTDDWFGSEVFSHPFFQKNNVELLEKMSCKKDIPAPPISTPVLPQMQANPSLMHPEAAVASTLSYQQQIQALNVSADNNKNPPAAAHLMATPSLQAQRFSPATSTLRLTDASAVDMQSRLQEEFRRRVQGQWSQPSASMQLRPDEAAETVQSRVAMSVEAEIERRTKERLESISKTLASQTPVSASVLSDAAASRSQATALPRKQPSHPGGMNYPTQAQMDSLAQSFQASNTVNASNVNLDTFSQQRRLPQNIGNNPSVPTEVTALETRQRILALEKKISEMQQLQRIIGEDSQTRSQQTPIRPQVNTASTLSHPLQQRLPGQEQQLLLQQQQQPSSVFAQQEETPDLRPDGVTTQSRMALSVEVEVNRRLQERLEALERARGQKLERLPPIQGTDSRIEEEVTRRLQDRVMAASMARRQQLHSMLQGTSIAAELQQQQKQQQQLSRASMTASSAATAMSRHQQATLQAQPQNPIIEGMQLATAESLLKQQYERHGIPAQQETRPLQKLPRPNREHARTA